MPPPAYTPTFERSACEFNQPEGREVRCGYLVVPENRANPSGQQVRIHVARFAPETTNPAPDPVVYLEGGPGGHALEGLEFSFEDRFAPLLSMREVIIFDQRGVGFSRPSLQCPEVRALAIEVLDDVLTAHEYTSREITALSACRDRLVADGADLSRYNSYTNAADVADLRIALGIAEWNLYGISYGTRLALTTMRDHPEGIRSVILDSTLPPDVDLPEQTPAAADRAFAALFDACATSPTCAATFPGLGADFEALQASLAAAPAPFEITDFLSGTSYPGVITGDDVSGLLFWSLYSEQLIPILPTVISDARAGDLAGLTRIASVAFTTAAFISDGMHFAVQCNEEYPFSTVAEVEAAVSAHPDVKALFGDTQGEFDLCAMWNSGTADRIEDAPVVSDIPALVMSGFFDPITPPAYGMRAAETLSRSYFFEFPGLGHGVSAAHECPLSMTLAFLDDPRTAPDSRCIDDMGDPGFLTPGSISLSLMPFTENIGGIMVSGVVPVGWDSAGFGQYAAPGLGDTAIVQQARTSQGVTVESMADGMRDFFEIDDWQESAYTNSRDWKVLEGTDGVLSYMIGLAEDNGLLLSVILEAPTQLLAEYASLAFYPALDAIHATL